jgi:hypothetical protein
MPELPAPSEYPNQDLGIESAQNTNVGAINQLAAPLQLGNAANGSGAIISSAAGTPASNNTPGNVGDLYIRTDPAGDSTYLYRCTVAGVAGGATWAAITGA